MQGEATQQEDGLFVPDRFEKLSPRTSAYNLKTIVEPVSEALERITDIHEDMLSAGGGAFIIWRGDSGVGKSTFLQTLDLFLEDIEIVIVPLDTNAQQYLATTEATQHSLRVIILEGREALLDVSVQALETSLHAINSFIRTQRGHRTLIAWPCNTDDLADGLVTVAKKLGAESLLGGVEPIFRFAGPPANRFTSIASKTVQVLNNGASLIDLGVSEERAEEISKSSETIGQYLIKLRLELRKNQKQVQKLLAAESCRLWVIVAAGNDPEGDVSALTRGQVLSADVERMMASTGANIVEELKRQPEQIGILGAVLDAKILYLPTLTALEAMRQFGSDELHKRMKDVGLTTKHTNQSAARINSGDLGTAFQGRASGLRTQGRKVGSNTVAAFEKLSLIAATNDRLLNVALGEALVAAGLIISYAAEQDLGNGLTRRTDLLCQTKSGPVRVELMWRRTTGRADISNYVLTKLYNYGKAIRFLS